LEECRAQLRSAVGRGDDFAHQLEVAKEHLALEVQRASNDRLAAANHLQVPCVYAQTQSTSYIA
jgi:hypothetical protein